MALDARPGQNRLELCGVVGKHLPMDIEGFGRMTCMTVAALREAAHCRAVAPG